MRAILCIHVCVVLISMGCVVGAARSLPDEPKETPAYWPEGDVIHRGQFAPDVLKRA